MLRGGVKPSTAARPSLRRCSTTCHASQQLARPPQRPTSESDGIQVQPTAGALSAPMSPQSQVQQQSAAAAYEQQLQRPQQQQGQLLTRPSLAPMLQQQQQLQQAGQQGSSSRRILLDDKAPKMAAFDQLTVQVTCSRSSAKPPAAAASFNRGPGKMKPIMAKNLKAARINRPTPLQGLMLPAILAGHDVLAAGPPGAGTSTAALLAVLCKVLSTPRTVPRNRAMPLAVVLCPSRELAMQLAAEGSKLVAGTQITVKCVTGGAEMTQQVIDLRHAADVLVCTPGRLLDLLAKKAVSLARLKHLVLEDVDELMGPVLSSVIRPILHHHTMPSYQQRQTIALGSSAFPQQQLLAAAVDVLRPSAVVIRAAWPLSQQQQQQQGEASSAIDVSAAAAAAAIPPSVTQRFLGVAPQLKMRFLLRLLSAGAATGGSGLVLVFTGSKTAAEDVWQQLDAAGVSAGVLHFAQSQSQRDEALQCFKYGVTQVLVACGIAHRGLDLPDVAQVINYNIPLSLAEYARRLGRAGRAGRPGVGTTLVTRSDGAAVTPLIAVLKASGQLVPDWLLSVAEGGNKADSAAGGGATLDGSIGSSSTVAAGGDGDPLQQLDRAKEAGMQAVGGPVSGNSASAGEAAGAGVQKAGSAGEVGEEPEKDAGNQVKFGVRKRRKGQPQFGSYIE